MSETHSPAPSSPASAPVVATVPSTPDADKASPERPVPDPTRYGDWEKNGRCIDF